MALATQHFDLYIIPNTTPPPVLDISQYDTSRTFVGHVKDIHGKPYNLPNGTTALLEGRNGNKVIFRLNVIVNNDTLTFTPDEILTDAPGRIHATISLDSTGQYLSPLRIIFNIQRAGITKEERATNPDFKDAVEAAFQAYIDEHGSGGGGGSGEMNVQSDWNQTNINSNAYIKNKPTKLSDFINDENFVTEADLPNTDNFPYITPEDYGAIGDGVTDDTDAIQKALAASITNGKTLFLENKYLVTETLLPNSYYSQTSATVNIVGASPMNREQYTASNLGGGTILFEHGENGLHLFDGSDGGLTLRGTIHGVKFAPTARAQKSAIFYRCILRGFVFEDCFVLNVLAFMHNSNARFTTKIRNSTFLTCYYFSKEDGEVAHSFVDSSIEGCYINGGAEMTNNHCFEWCDFNGSNVTGNFIDYYRTIYAPWCGIKNGEPDKKATQFPISANNQYQVFRYFYDPTHCSTFQLQSDSDCFNWTAPSTLEKLQGYTPLTYTGHDEQTHEMSPYVLGVFETGKVEINNAIFQNNIGNIVFVRAAAVNYEYAKAKLTCNINDNFYTYDTYVAMADAIWEKGSYRLNLIDIPFVKNVESLPSIDVPGGWNAIAYPGMRVRNNGHVYRYRWVRNGSVWVAKWVDEVPESTDGFVRFVTPEQFGAVGDGEADDTLAIQAAFDAASNGGTVKFGLKKTYMVSRRDDDVRRVYASDSNGQPAPTKMKYMLRISGSMTILGQGSTITYKYPIKKSEYDVEQGSPGSTRPMYTDNAKSAVMLFLDNSTKNEGSNAEVNERNYVCIKGLVLDGAWERRIDDIEDPNSPFVRDLSTYGGGKGANWKAICAHGVRGMVLELDSVTVKEFAGEGVYGTYNPGSKVRAFGCTFTNCMPSAFNVAGSFVEAIGCVFNQTEDETKGSEIAGDKNLFDSCTFNIENGFPAIVYGHSNQELIVRNCVFNRTSYKRPVSEVGEQMFINIPNATNVMIDSCVFNDNHQDNHEETFVTTRSASIGKINNCTFNRTEMQANNTMTVLIAQDSISNVVHVTTFPSDGAGIIGRGLLIYLNNLSSYKLTKISPPKSFTIIPVNDCTFTRWGFGNQIVNVNKTVYAHSRVNIPVDYFSLSSAPGYNSTYLYFEDFFVECSGTFNIIIET